MSDGERGLRRAQHDSDAARFPQAGPFPFFA